MCHVIALIAVTPVHMMNSGRKIRSSMPSQLPSSKDFIKELKKCEMRPDPNAFISLGIEVKGHPISIKGYSEKDLEQAVTCESCTLEYTIYGAFGFCPDCGVHNSLQILKANLEVIDKMLLLATHADAEIMQKLIENALEDAVSAFDGFGRELCRVNSSKASSPKTAETLSFQSIGKARASVNELFGFDFASLLSDDDWRAVTVHFERRHLLAHRMGVIDETFVAKTGGSPDQIGRKAHISDSEVKDLLQYLKAISQHLFDRLNAKQ